MTVITTSTKRTARDAFLDIALALHAELPQWTSMFEAASTLRVTTAAGTFTSLQGVFQAAGLSPFAGLVEDDLNNVADAYAAVGSIAYDAHRGCCDGECTCSLPKHRGDGPCDRCEGMLVHKLDEQLDRLQESLAAGTSLSRVLRVMGAAA